MDADVTGSESLQLDWKNQSSSALQGTIEADIKKRSEAIVEKVTALAVVLASCVV
jgi:outer membrane protease